MKQLPKNEILKIIEERKQIVYYDDRAIEAKCDELLDALGDDLNEVYNFVENADDEMFTYLVEIYEELIEKFQSRELDMLFASRILNK